MKESKRIERIPIDRLRSNPFQMRIDYSEDELKDLGRSIKEDGLLEPIVVRRKGRGYEICIGERRVRACRLVGIRAIPAMVRDLSNEEMAEYGLVENLQRRNLSPIEEARGFRILHERFNWTQEKIAKELGCGLTRDIVAQRLRLLTFPIELQEAVSHDTITTTHAETLARLADEPRLLKEALGKVLGKKLATNETEQLVKDTIEEQKVCKQNMEYVFSLQFITDLFFLYDAVIMNTISDWHYYCLFCNGEVKYGKGRNGTGTSAQMRCTECGWPYLIDSGTLSELARRIGQLRNAQRNQSMRK